MVMKKKFMLILAYQILKKLQYLFLCGTNTTSWYLKQNSTNGVVASGFGGLNYPNINPNECYTLLILQGDNQTFSITDGHLILAQGTVSGEEYKSNFRNRSMELFRNYSKHNLCLPNPTNDKLYIEEILII